MTTLPTLETDRLVLRPYNEGDAARVLDIHSRMEVIKWLSNPPFVPMADLDAARDWVARWAETRTNNPQLGCWAIEVKDTEIVAGSALLAFLPESDLIQVGWHLHPDSSGHGYATEAARAVLAEGFGSGIDEIWANMYPDNAPSAGVCLRLGMPDLGIRDDPWYGEQSRMFLMNKQQWDAS